MGACGDRHSIALTNAGEIYMWGSFSPLTEENISREKSLKSFDQIRPQKLVPIKNGQKKTNVVFVKITSGNFHSAAIDQEGFIYTWGDCSSGCLGHKDIRERSNPTQIMDLTGLRTLDVACGEKFTVGVFAKRKSKIICPAVDEFNKEAYKTIQEKLNIIKNFKKETHELKAANHLRMSQENPDTNLLITKISQNQIYSNLTNFYHKDDRMRYNEHFKNLESPIRMGTDDSGPPMLSKSIKSMVIDEIEEDLTGTNGTQESQQFQRNLKKSFTYSSKSKTEKNIDDTSPRSKLDDNATPMMITTEVAPFMGQNKTLNTKFTAYTTKHTSTQNGMNITQLNYVFDDATQKLSKKNDYLLSYDTFVKPLDKVEDPFKPIIEKVEKANKQVKLNQLVNKGQKHTRIGEKGVSAHSTNRPTTASMKNLPMKKILPLPAVSHFSQLK